MRETHPPPALVALGLLAAVLVLGMLLGSGAGLEQRRIRTVQGNGTETATLDPTRFSEPLYTSQEAISASLPILPDGFEPIDTVAQLISAESLDNWRGAITPLMDANAPVWLVGITANGMTLADALPMLYGESGFAPPRGGTPAALAAQSIQGMFYAWDANSGVSLGQGALLSISGQDFASISALPTVTATIVPATIAEFPEDGTVEPSVTP